MRRWPACQATPFGLKSSRYWRSQPTRSIPSTPQVGGKGREGRGGGAGQCGRGRPGLRWQEVHCTLLPAPWRWQLPRQAERPPRAHVPVCVRHHPLPPTPSLPALPAGPRVVAEALVNLGAVTLPAGSWEEWRTNPYVGTFEWNGSTIIAYPTGEGHGGSVSVPLWVRE